MPEHESDWVFETQEVSANVFQVTGRDGLGRTVGRTGTDPDMLLAECRGDAETLPALADAEGTGDPGADAQRGRPAG